MKNRIKQKLKGLDAVIDRSNRQGCSVQLINGRQWEMFEGRIKYYFPKFRRISNKNTSKKRYNIYASYGKTASDLIVFDFAEDRFLIQDLFGLVLEHVKLHNNIDEFVVVLKTSELEDEAEFKDYDTEDLNWSWDFIEQYFARLYENDFELIPQQLFVIEEGKLHIHFKIEAQ